MHNLHVNAVSKSKRQNLTIKSPYIRRQNSQYKKTTITNINQAAEISKYNCETTTHHDIISMTEIRVYISGLIAN